MKHIVLALVTFAGLALTAGNASAHPPWFYEYPDYPVFVPARPVLVPDYPVFVPVRPVIVPVRPVFVPVRPVFIPVRPVIVPRPFLYRGW